MSKFDEPTTLVGVNYSAPKLAYGHPMMHFPIKIDVKVEVADLAMNELTDNRGKGVQTNAGI